MQAERTRWFSAMTEPPVNGSGDAVYERQCLYLSEPTLGFHRKAEIGVVFCRGCQWRGLTERGVRQWQRGAR